MWEPWHRSGTPIPGPLCTIVREALRTGEAWPYLGVRMNVRASTASGLATCVRRRRGALGLDQVELAELAGCSTRFVHSVEAGKPTLRLDKLLDVLRVLGLSLRVVRGSGTVEGPETPAGGEGDPVG